jgi:hypothetical protein
MHELTNDKKQITEEHLDKMIESHERMAKLIDDAMKEAQTKGSGDLTFFGKLKAMVSIDRNKILKMPEQDMLQYSKMWFDLTKQNFDVIMSISKDEYSSLLKQIDDHLLFVQQQINKIDEELKDVDDEKKHKFMLEQKEKWMTREW